MTKEPVRVRPDEHRHAVRVRGRALGFANPAQWDGSHWDALGQQGVDLEPRRRVRRGALHAEAHPASPLRVGGDGHDDLAAAVSDPEPVNRNETVSYRV